MVAAVSPVVREQASAGSQLRFRADIQGLRAVAVVFVVLHHVGVPGFDAGFIGVDVFFVISGFLITRKLIDEITDSGSIALAHFWVGRIRRLLPIAATVIATTMVASLLVANPLDWARLVDDARAGTLFVANVHFGGFDSGYFTEGARDSPFLHLWSLAVEEQFYVLVPLVLAAALRVRRRGTLLERPVLVLVALSLASLAVASVLTDIGTPHAYYSLASRGWELGAGCLLAFAWPWVVRHRAGGRTPLIALGVALTIAGLVFVDRTAFPAWGAVLPVAGTILLIAGEADTSTFGRAIGSRPMRAVGRWSYGWYLWHWPFLVLGTQVLGDTTAANVGLAGASLGLSAVTYRTIEQPVRRASLRPRRGLALGAALLAALLLVVEVADIRTSRYFDDPDHARVLAASTDWFDLEPECVSTDASALLRSCTTGSTAPGGRVLLYGDSHLSHWRPAIEPAASALGGGTVRSILGNCFALAEGRTKTTAACQERAAGVHDLVRDLRPAGVVLGLATVYRDIRIRGAQPADQLDAWRLSIHDLAAELRRLKIPLLVLLDVPRYDSSPLECMIERDDWSPCSLPTAQVLEANGQVNAAIRRGLADAGHGDVFDPVPLLCSGTRCALEYRGAVLPQDSHHLTTAAAAQFEPVFRTVLAELLTSQAPSA